MEETKYRAWHIKEKIMYDVGTLEFMEGGVKFYGPGVRGGWVQVSDKFKDKIKQEAILIQYIGLKDKNGNEIYEGDWVKHWHEELFFDDNVEGLIVWSEENAAFCIEYDNCGQLISAIDLPFAEIEIIGNMYENPELIK